MIELYEMLLKKTKQKLNEEKETNLSAATEKLISTTLKVYHASRLEREAKKEPELPPMFPPVITAE